MSDYVHAVKLWILGYQASARSLSSLSRLAAHE